MNKMLILIIINKYLLYSTSNKYYIVICRNCIDTDSYIHHSKCIKTE